MERRDLYQDDLTEERDATPAQRDDAARTQVLDPDVPQDGESRPMPAPRAAGDSEDEAAADDEDEDEEEDEDDEDES